MFGKISKLALGISLLGGVISGRCSTTESIIIPNEATIMIQSLTDSLEFKKPTRVFIALMGSLNTICNEFNSLAKNSISIANQQFFTALSHIFSDSKPEVDDASVEAILKSAEEGCGNAQEMIKAALGKNPSVPVANEKELLKKQIQEVIDKSTSDSDNSSVSSDSGNIKERGKDMALMEEIEEEPIPESILYMSLESAWADLNDFSKKQNEADRNSAISSLVAYVKNHGSIKAILFKKLLGRICYEHNKALSPEEKALLNIEKIQDIKKYGLELLQEAAQQDSEAQDYLDMAKL